MYLYARIFAIFVYIIFMGLFYLLISKIKCTQRNILFVSYLIVLIVFAYIYTPDSHQDLFRIWEHCKLLASYRADVFFITMLKSGMPIACLVYRMVGLTALYQILPMSACILTYGSVFYIISSYSKKRKISGKTVAITLLFVMTMDFFVPVISNLRSYIATALIVFCIYREEFEKKFNVINVVLYIISIGIHLISVIFVLLRLINYIANKNSIYKRKTLKDFVIILCVGGIYLIYRYFGSSVLYRFTSYLFGDTYWYSWEYIICVIQLINSAYVYILARKFRLNAIFSKGYWKMYSSSLIALVFCCINFSFFMRWTFFFCLMELPVYLEVIEVKKRKNERRILVLNSIIILFLTMSRGFLCGLKFW